MKSVKVGRMNWKRVDEALEGAVYAGRAAEAAGRKHVFPGAVLLVARGGEVLYFKSFGYRSIVPEENGLDPDTVFDVASLTKPIITTTLIMQLIDRGQLTLDRRVSRILQTFSVHGKERITVRHLLNHSSGYPGYAPYYKQIARASEGERAGIMTSRGAVEMVYNEIVRARTENPPGKVAKYSDIGFILLGHLIEVLHGGQPLDKIALKNIIAPLQLPSTGYVDLSKMKRRGLEPVTDMIAPTAECPWRERILCGEVHDDNAWAMGGVAGHAGLFSTARDVHAFATEMIECYHGRGGLVSQDTVRKFWTLDNSIEGSSWALGWDTPSPENSSSGRYFSRNSVGHLGFTGCSLWIDPDRELDVVLLSNRVHPTPENNLIREFRPLVHDLVMETLGLAEG